MDVTVFDPAMCCSTGVCGPAVDPALATFAADLDWLAGRDVHVRRINLGQEPGEFVANETVRDLLQVQGEAGLPAVFVDGELRASGRLPSREEMSAWTERGGNDIPEQVITTLAAIGAAIGANCELCFKHHYGAARRLGLSNSQLAAAVRTAQGVKEVPATKVLDTAARLLRVDPAAIGGPVTAAATGAEGGAESAGGCCGEDAHAPVPPTADDTAECAPGSGCC